MTDGSGTHAYAYDPLSRLVSETQTFTGLTGNFTTSYSYELSGKLKAVTDAFSDAVYYNNDVAGRTTSITGSSFAGVSSYATGIKYRAFGALKEMTYSSTDSAKVSYDFDAALRPVSYEATSSVLSGGYVRKASYEYFNDGSMKKVNDLLNASFDQTYSYDFAGRLASSTTGTALNRNDETVTPYAQTIQYDAFGNMTHRTTDVWGNEDGFTATYANNRKASGGVLDNEGNMVDSTVAANNYSRWEFDASGKNVETKMAWRIGHVGETQIDRVDTIVPTRDGDGVTVKRVDTKTGTQVYPVSTTTTIKTEYYLISTVLGGKVLTELTAAGTKKRTSVYVGSGVLAEQLVRAADDTHSTEWEEVLFKHEDIVTGSYNKTNGDGTLSTSGEPPARAELEPLGGRIPDNDPEVTDEAQNFDLSTFRHFGNLESAEFGCELDGMPFPCSLVDELRRGDESHYKFGVRYQGDEHGAWGLSTFVRDIYKDDEGPDKTPVPDKGPIKVDGATRYQYSIFSLLFSPSASSHGPSPDSEGDLAVLTMSDHCRQMVGKLREFIDQSVNSVGPINDMAGVDKLLKKIDSAFFDFFVGPLNFVSTQASGPPGVYSGSSGFKDDYKDSLPGQRYSDQTHHFAAYFHAGIWAGISWKAYAHSLTDRWTNEGDRQLGEAAFSLGVSLRARQTGSFTRTNRNNPRAVFPETVPIYESYEDRLKRILGIADAIEKAICD